MSPGAKWITPGQPGMVPDHDSFHADATRRAAQRFGLPPGVTIPHLVGSGNVTADWERDVLAAFERGGALTRTTWNHLSPNGKHQVLRTRRYTQQSDVRDVIDGWLPSGSGLTS